MTDVRNIIARGKTLTGRKLRQAIESATGKVVGGRGIKVITVNNNAVVSLLGHQIIGGGGAGQSVPGIITEVDPPDGPNSAYTFRSLDSVSVPPTNTFMAPNNRAFDTQFVDFDPAQIGEYIRIWAIWPAAFPLVSPEDKTTGACITVTGECTVKASADCDGDDVFYPGEPCAIIDVIEFTQTTQCTASAAESVLPPPPILSSQELLT